MRPLIAAALAIAVAGAAFAAAQRLGDDDAPPRASSLIQATTGSGDHDVVVTVANRKRVVVPDLIGSRDHQARARLRKLGLRSKVVQLREVAGLSGGTIVDQVPAPGKRIMQGSLVRLTMSRGPSSVP
jgi:beta-lactam-binding protein with PASTA domain